MIRILVVNPNRIPGCTTLIDRAARAAASARTVVTTVAPVHGPIELDGPLAVQLSALGALERIAAHQDDVDVAVLAGFGEPGLEAARDMVAHPVLDITACGPAFALGLGRRYAVVTSSRGAVPDVQDRLAALGLDARCAGVVATGLSVPAMIADRHATLDNVAARVTTCATELGADTVVLGCGGLAGLAAELTNRTRVPVVDPVTATVATAESLVRLGPRPPRTSTARQPVQDWPVFPARQPGG